MVAVSYTHLIVGETREDILKSAKRVETSGADLAEWRVDWYESVFCVSKVESIAGELRKILKDIPLLFTFRTAREGGKKAIDLKPVSYTHLPNDPFFLR